MPKPREVIGGTQTNSCQASVCQPCVLAVPRTVKVGLTKVGNQTKSRKYSGKKVVYITNFELIFKQTATDLNTQPTKTQQRMAFTVKNARFLLPQRYGQYESLQNQLAMCKSMGLFLWDRKRPIGVMSGDLGGQATGPPHPIQ